MPRKVFVAGEILTAADVNTNLMDQAVMVFGGTATRGSAIPSPSEGMVTYLEDSNQVQVYDGSGWGAVSKILQVVSTTKNDVFSTTSTSFVDVTGLSVSITPSATSNKIFVVVDGQFSNSAAGQITRVNLLRDSTALAQSSGSSTGDQTYAAYTASTGAGTHVGISYLDSPSSTSSLTYKVQVAVSGASTAYVNRYAANNAYQSSSFITVMEVAG